MRIQSYDKAISIYKKALRKENLEFGHRTLFLLLQGNFLRSNIERLSKTEFITSQLTDAYFKSVRNHFDMANSYFRPDTINLQLLDKVISECEKINKLYEDYQKTFTSIPKVINNKWNEILSENMEARIKFCFIFGEQYIKNKMWQEAKNFYTKKILKYLNPVVTLENLYRLYNADEYSDIKEKIWGKDIFVVLEDFEDSSKSVLISWAKSTKPIVKVHAISTGISYTGRCAEYFDLLYTQEGYDYWVKSTVIPLDNLNLNLGIRLFIKSKKPFQGNLGVNVIYPKQGTSGVWHSNIKENIREGWEIRIIDKLFEEAKAIASRDNWNMSGIKIDKIIVDTAGVSNQFYVDDIELYLIDERGAENE